MEYKEIELAKKRKKLHIAECHNMPDPESFIK
jgi:hypothetical protein